MTSLEFLARLPASEVLLALILLALAVGLGRSLPWGSSRPPGAFAGEETATATLDFTLVFPLFTMVILVLIQLALLINARLVVSYAAFTACRSAVVWLEEGEEIARERAQGAAEVGCLPISPGRLAAGLGAGSALSVAPLYMHSRSSNLPRRILRGGSKLTYSKLATTAEIILPKGKLGPHDPVTVEVEHAFYLSVPYGDRVFRGSSGPGGLPVRTIRDRFTLTHEGRVQSR